MEYFESKKNKDLHNLNTMVIEDMHLESEFKKLESEYEVLSTRKQVINNFTDEESKSIDEKLYLIFEKVVIINQKRANLYLNNTEKLLDYLNLENNQFNQNRITKNQYGFVIALDLNECNFTEIPENIFYLTQLAKINISNNQINKIPDCIEVASCLESIKITNNNISSLPIGFGKLGNIKSLNLKENDFEDLTDIINIIKNLPQLSDLYIYQSQIEPIPTNLNYLNHLSNLNIEVSTVERSIENDSKRYSELKKLLPNTKINFTYF